MPPRRALLLATLCAPGFLVVLDSNMVTLALPAMRTDLQLSGAGSQWIIGAYSLAFGGALLLAGRASDVFGHRRLLTAGMLGFSLASVAAALAPGAGLLLGARVVEGLGAALAIPASLALMTNLFAEPDSRTRALGVYGVAVSSAFVAGVALGGALTALAGWRAVFLATAPIGLVGAAAVPLLVRRDRVRGRVGELDLLGACAAIGAVLALLYGLALAARGTGLSLTTCCVLALSLLCVGVARTVERRARVPLLAPRLLGQRAVAGACVAALLTVATGAGVMFVLSLYLQEVLEYGPATSGLALTLLGVAGVGAGSAAPIVARHLGLRRGLVAALVVQAGGVALLMPMGADRGLQPILVGTAVIGAGHFGATVLFTALATSAVGEGQRGVVIGLVSSGQQIGAALGLALLVGVASLGAVGTRTDASLVEGFQRALVVGVGMSLLGAALVLTLTRESDRRSPHGSRTGRCPEH